MKNNHTHKKSLWIINSSIDFHQFKWPLKMKHNIYFLGFSSSLRKNIDSELWNQSQEVKIRETAFTLYYWNHGRNENTALGSNSVNYLHYFSWCMLSGKKKKKQPINLVECILIGTAQQECTLSPKLCHFLRSGVFKGYFLQLLRVRVLRAAGPWELARCHLKDLIFQFRRNMPFI